MALSQQKRRELIFQLLFSHDFSHFDEEMVDFMMKEFFITKKEAREVLSCTQQISENLSGIDEYIRQHSHSYEFDRIAKIELNILRLSAYEILFVPSLPPKVSISEAIRLAKKYSTSESTSFVNAVLDAIFHAAKKEVEDEHVECVCVSDE